MHQTLQQELVRRLLVHLDRRTTDSEPGPTFVRVDEYADESARLFRELPLAVGHVSQLREPGDFFTHDHAGMPLLVVRGDDGEVRAFLNVCRHRGTRVEAAACGARKAFVCPYHAWSYGCDGTLLGIPHERGFAGVERAERGLVRVPCGIAAGLIFVRPSPGDGPLDLDGWLGPVAGELAGFGIASGCLHAPLAKHRALSWKLAIDIFLEAYHLRRTHGDSIYPMFFDNLALVDLIAQHVREVLPKRTIRELPAQPPETWSLRHHANVLYQLFPNTLVLVEPDHAEVVHMWPQGPARTLVTAYMIVPEPPASEKALRHWAANDAVLQSAVDEDFAMGESIQRGLASGANREVVFGAFEHGLAHFHRQLARYTAG